VLSAAVCLVCALAVAEDEAEEAEVLTSLEQRMLKRISVNFRSTPIDDVIRIIAEQADVDIVKSPAVIGEVTTTLTDVPLEEALSNILAAHGYGYIASKNMIRIVPIAEITEKSERLVSRIYRITYADVTEVEKALKKFISKRGSLSASPATSNVIVTDTESKIKAIDTFIDEVDRITPLILVEVRIYDVTSRDKLDLGIEWDAGSRTTYTASEPTARNTDPFIASGFEGATGKTADTTLGFFRFGWFNDSIDIDAQLRAEEEDTDAKLLANPRILVLDNEKALFDIVTEHPYAERNITGTTITETIKFKRVGVKLAVTPHVTSEGMLRLHIIPEFGVVVSQAQFATSDVPVVDTRKVDTIALLRDGQTVVIGGLRKKDVSKQVNKVPFLGDLPVVGALFRFEGEDTSVNELIVFITPRIINQAFLSTDEENAYEETKFDGPKPSLTRSEESNE
jgi:type IV pilus assembly protein PilQ